MAMSMTKLPERAEEATANGGRGRRPWALSSTAVQRLAVVAVLAGIWQAVVELGIIRAAFLPSPTMILAAGYELAQDPAIRLAMVQLLVVFLVAFLLAALAGVIVGVAMGGSRFVNAVLKTPVLTLYSTPKIIFIPLFVIFLGFDTRAAILYGAVAGFFPIAITVTGGVQMIDETLIRATRSLGASRWQQFIRLTVPATMPALAAALWYGCKHSLLGVLIMALYSSSDDAIGYYIKLNTATLNSDRVYAIIGALALFAMLLGGLWRMQEIRSSKWQENP